MPRGQKQLSIETIAIRTGLRPHAIRRCMRVGLVSLSLTEDDLAELRRIRRLTELNVNLAGVEIIVRMYRQIVSLQAELADVKRRLKE